MAYAPGVDLGTLKIVTVAEITNFNPTTTPQTTNIACAAFCPFGTKALHIRLVVRSSAAGDYAACSKTGTSYYTLMERTQVANVYTEGSGVVLLDSNRTFDVLTSHLNIDYVSVVIVGYYI